MSRGTLAALLILITASNAQAWEAFFRISCETTFRGSSETSNSSTRAEQAGRRQANSNGTSQGMPCRSDDECYGYCDVGRCVDHPPVASPPPAQNTPIIVHPANPIDPSYDPSWQLAPPQPAPSSGCVSPDQCPQGQPCVNGQCLPPPSSSLWKRGSQLYLRERTVQLRQDLALGEGPVIAALATMQGVSAAKLGSAMRARRDELMQIVGDGTDPRWTSRFLARLEALCPPPVSVSAR